MSDGYLRRAAAIAVALIAASPAIAADAYLARNGLRVEGTGGQSFVVPYGGKPAARSFWCAAGDYAIAKLGVPPATPIYRDSPPPRRSGEGIRFTLAPTDTPAEVGLIRIGGGNALAAAEARFLCELDNRFGSFGRD